MGSFPAELARLRARAGFTTGYAFYHRCGGRRAFPFTFAYYRKLERGELLPRAQWLAVIMDRLGAVAEGEAGRGLAESYLRSLFPAGEDFEALIAPFLRRPLPGESGGARPARATRLPSEAQRKAVLSDAESFWAFACLSHRRASWSSPELAETTGLSEIRLGAALARLEQCGLAKESTPGRYRSALPGGAFVFSSSAGADGVRVAALVDEAASRRGEPARWARLMLRAEPGPAGRAFSALRAVLESCAAVGDRERHGDLVVLRVRARKAFDF